MTTDDTRARRRALAAFWCALWIVVGGWTGYEVWQLSRLSETVADTGRTLGEAGQALQSLDPVPVVGDATARIGSEVRQNSADIVRSAAEAGESVRRLSILLGLSIGLVPTVPVLVAVRALERRSRPVAEG